MQGTHRRSLPLGLIAFVLVHYIAAQPSIAEDSAVVCIRRPNPARRERVSLPCRLGATSRLCASTFGH